MRSRIKVIPSPLDKILDDASMILLLAMWVFTIYALVKMPESIPSHYDAVGNVNAYGNKATLLVSPVLATIVVIGLTALNKHPHFFNYPTEITAENAGRQYTLATRMLRFLKLAIVLISSEISASTFFIAIGKANKISSWFLPTEIGLMFIPVVVLIIQSLRKQRLM